MPSTPWLNRVRTRAQHRATAKLRELYRDEYDTLFAAEMERAKAEATGHIATARVEHPGHRPAVKPAGAPGPRPGPLAPLPPALMPGPSPTGAPRLREDVARCPYCARYHDRGHTCGACGHRPPAAPPRRPYTSTGYTPPPARGAGRAAALCYTADQGWHLQGPADLRDDVA